MTATFGNATKLSRVPLYANELQCHAHSVSREFQRQHDKLKIIQLLKIDWIIVMFYQLFGLSFWRHPFTAEHPLVRKWCDATFSKSSPMNKQTHLLFAWPKNIVIYLTSIMRATKLLPSTIMHMKTSRQPLTGYYQTSSIVLDLSSALALMSFYHRGFSKSTSRPVFPQAVRFAAFWAAHYSQAIV